jgi:deazaflavin-dependent oxidoreductase (nitroreductase family)
MMRAGQRFFTGLHTRIYRASHGRIGSHLGPVENVLLTTTGRRTGRMRTTPLGCLPDGDRLVLVASNGGATHHPDWYLNLCADPHVTVQRGAQVRPMLARTATPQERDVLWPRVVQRYAGYARYQAHAPREIPLVICEEEPRPPG